jgi:DNA-binding protein
VVLTGCGRAIPKAVAVAEILKRRVPGAHQVTDVSSLTNDDRFEAIESGLDDVRETRRVSVVRVALCRDAREMDANAPGYQPPIEAGRVSPLRTGAALESRARRRRRARAATRKPKPPLDDATEDADADEAQARVGDGTTPNGKRRVRRGGGGRRRAEEGGARNREEPIDA